MSTRLELDFGVVEEILPYGQVRLTRANPNTTANDGMAWSRGYSGVDCGPTARETYEDPPVGSVVSVWYHAGKPYYGSVVGHIDDKMGGETPSP